MRLRLCRLTRPSNRPDPSGQTSSSGSIWRRGWTRRRPRASLVSPSTLAATHGPSTSGARTQPSWRGLTQNLSGRPTRSGSPSCRKSRNWPWLVLLNTRSCWRKSAAPSRATAPATAAAVSRSSSACLVPAIASSYQRLPPARPCSCPSRASSSTEVVTGLVPDGGHTASMRLIHEFSILRSVVRQQASPLARTRSTRSCPARAARHAHGGVRAFGPAPLANQPYPRPRICPVSELLGARA